MTKNLTLLGSTGSIGVQSLDVARKNNINITALSAGGGRIDLLEQQAREFKPKTVAVFSENGAKELKSRLRDTEIKVLRGEDGGIEAAVELCDGAVIAQLGVPDMKLPIQYALTYPDRTECLSERLDLSKIGTLTFDKPDFETFLCLKTCIEAINEGKLKPVAANGANEVAVKLFLDGKIKFPDIGRIVKGAADNQKTVDTFTLSDIFDADNTAREFVYSNWM